MGLKKHHVCIEHAECFVRQVGKLKHRLVCIFPHVFNPTDRCSINK